MSIYLIRHGETPSNAKRVLQHPDSPLSERGRSQAERLAERLANSGIERLLSSDYTRAEQTARAVAARTGLALEFDESLRERNYGDLRGRAYDDLGFDPHAPEYTPPGGESWEDFHERVGRAFGRITRAAEETEGALAVVTHGLVCYSLIARRLKLDAPPELMGFGNTSVTIVESRPPWRVELLDCCKHLDESTRDPRTVSGL